MSSDLRRIVIPQGKNWEEIFQWLSDVVTFKPITDISLAAPCVLTVPGHGLQSGWLFSVEECKGTTQINTQKDIEARVVDGDHLELNGVNGVNFSAYQGGGVIRYRAPVELPADGQMMIRKALTDTDPVIVLNVANGKLIIDSAARTCTARLRPLDTAPLDFDRAYFDLEMIAGTNDVPYFDNGVAILQREAAK